MNKKKSTVITAGLLFLFSLFFIKGSNKGNKKLETPKNNSTWEMNKELQGTVDSIKQRNHNKKVTSTNTETFNSQKKRFEGLDSVTLSDIADEINDEISKSKLLDLANNGTISKDEELRLKSLFRTYDAISTVQLERMIESI